MVAANPNAANGGQMGQKMELGFEVDYRNDNLKYIHIYLISPNVSIFQIDLCSVKNM